MAHVNAFLEALQTARGTWNPKAYKDRIEVSETILGIASDVHIPFHHEALVAEMLATFAEYKVEAIVWSGDLFDLPYFSSYDQVEQDTDFLRDLCIGRTLLRQAASIRSVKRQYWSSGNHDWRALRKMGFKMGMRQLALLLELQDMLDDAILVISDNPTMNAYHGRWAITHPEQYGAQPLAVPGRLADLWQQHVISGHAHHWGQGTSPSGRYRVIESGGLFDPGLFEYVQWHPRAGRQMKPGYWVIDRETPIGFLGTSQDQRAA